MLSIRMRSFPRGVRLSNLWWHSEGFAIQRQALVRGDDARRSIISTVELYEYSGFQDTVRISVQINPSKYSVTTPYNLAFVIVGSGAT